MNDNTNGRNGPLPGLALRLMIPVLGLAGMGISGYLTYVHYRWIEPVCFAGLDCNSVLFSPYATLWGVPLSLLGLVMYFFLTVGGILLLYNKAAAPSALGIYTLALAGALYSLFLINREFEMHAFCSWCLVSALVITCTLVISLVNLAGFGVRLTRVPRLIGGRLLRVRHCP
jgi:uncharacterized membrane protein